MTSPQQYLIVAGFCLLISLQVTYQQNVFQQSLTDTNVEPGSFGNLVLRVSPEITDAGQWFKDGVELFDIPGKLQIAVSGQLRQLVIFSIRVSDTGRYSFSLRGQTTSAFLTVGDVVAGVWGEWTQWSGPPCPATCGPTATHAASRSRSCSFANSCAGEGSQSGMRSCAPACGAVNGNWGEWTQWSGPSCSATCGPTARRTLSRSRTCNNPAPRDGGAPCSGETTQSQNLECGPATCAPSIFRVGLSGESRAVGEQVLFQVEFIQSTATSVIGTWRKNDVVIVNGGNYIIASAGSSQYLYITNLQVSDSGRYSYTYDGETTAAQLTVGSGPINGNWGAWGQWSGPPCPATCGPTARHTASRIRSCNNPAPSNGGATCSGDSSQSGEQQCGPAVCVSTWNNWGQWIDSACPATCGVGVTQTATRSRTCNQQAGQPFCSGSSTDSEVRVCSLPLCPVNGNWGGWSQWSGPPCSSTCGPTARRTLSRTRFCNNPAPSNGGANCLGQATETNDLSCGPSICETVTSTWNNWGQWIDSSCPATCGVGVTQTATRSRTCNQPSGQPFCSGSSTDSEVRTCSLSLCPVNGNWAQWSQWSGPSCSVTCGPTARRTITRSRSCSNPPPSNGGASCPGQAEVTDAISCGPSTCETVTSTWNNWGQWFDPGCSATCGVGVTRTATRSRTCNQQAGQPFCSGSSTDSEVRVCSLPLCPVNGNWGQWSQWTDPSCPATCGPSARRTISRTRSCNNPAPSNGGVFCAGLARETQDLSCGPSVCVQSTWNNWGQWIDSDCPATCGVGVTQTATRSRTCNQQAGQPFCSGSSTDSEVRACSLSLCPVNGNWAQWSQWSGPSCSVTCGPTARRTITRSRFCSDPPPSNGGATCPGQAEVTDAISCGPSTCETVTSTWNNWGQWIDPGCSASCGADLTRTASRSRTCNQQAGQPFCSGSSTDSEVRVCSLPLCPVNGNWGQWSQWSDPSCPATCGPSARRTISRTRSCNNPAPSNGGVFCAGLARETQDLSCGPSVCANITIDGGYSQWTMWSAGQCSVRCGDGLKTDTRTRSCTEPTPQNGGLPCAGPATEIRTAPCTVTCEESAWSTWIGPSCPSTCGRHVTITQERSRTCRVLNPSGSDSTCGVSLRETRNFTCVDILCPVDGGFSPWGVWVTYNVCTGTCERELQTLIRTRSCNNPTPAFNGRICQGDTLEQKQDFCVVPVNCTGSAVNGNWGAWTSWGGPSCPATCGPTARHTVTRARSCNNPPPSSAGATCPGDNSEMQIRDCGAASLCETAVSWSDWGQWVDPGCGVTCGVGVKRTSARTRTCDQKPGQPTCPGNNTQSEVKACDLPVCQGVIYSYWGEWTQWSSPLCSASCGPAARHTVIRTRFCTEGTDCPGEGRQSENRSCGNECPTTGAATQTGTILLALVGTVVSLCLM
ncbi:SCO-spondin-like isoform X3 [Haliotis rufescens]|uniref:SCO-spondin-like isoform X3 n=1 Tax=Haliotis rufescens TaxID=6454 RepID=UPI00201E8E04|nr:SCO-spondin-like isoform X3 [Haliotis rufescens]